MDRNAAGEESDNIDWDTSDELEIQDMPFSSALPAGQELSRNSDVLYDSDDEVEIQEMPVSCQSLPPPGNLHTSGNGEASSSRAPKNTKLIQQFVGMGFSEALVIKAIEEDGTGLEGSILESILSYAALESSPPQMCASSDQSVSDDDEDYLNDFSDADSFSEIEENTNSLSRREKTLLSLEKMGYTEEEASLALERCGPNAKIEELADFICAAQMARAEDIYCLEAPNEIKPRSNHLHNASGRLKKRKREREPLDEGNETIRLPKPMVGFGIPPILCPADELCPMIHRRLPERARGSPFFYYENVALAPKGVWDEISRSLYDVEPEFVDSQYFCAAARKRGYVHNLPIEDRFPLLPLPPRTIHDALPLTKRWWPKWDKRTKLNCLQTAIASARLTDRIRKALEAYEDEPEPPMSVQRDILEQCRKWNLVWVGRNKVAPLECDEVELLLGFPKNHTRGGGISRTDRYKSLGNSFQVDTVAYHLSVLKDLFPNGINMLSLFSGIGGAEVALHRLGVPLKNVVSVEKSEVNRNIVKSWWEQTNQKGNLIEYDDVEQINGYELEKLMKSFGPFDLVVGGSPCNNLAGSNRVSRDGLEGEHSSLFYHYPRILELIKCIVGRQS